jgi:hypothetical protein
MKVNSYIYTGVYIERRPDGFYCRRFYSQPWDGPYRTVEQALQLILDEIEEHAIDWFATH